MKKVAELKTSHNEKTYKCYLYDKEHFVIVSQKKHFNPITGETKILFITIDLPTGSANWFVNTIEQKFMKGPNEGGLPAGEFKFKENVEGEDLYVSRGASIGGDGISGYDLINFSRPKVKRPSSFQNLSMSDDLLFKHGLFDLWKDLAEKVKNGTI